MSYQQSGAWAVDQAMRVLATGCAAECRPAPAAGAVVLGSESMLVRMTTPDEAAPPGWTVADHGRTWRTELRRLQDAAVDDRIPDPYPLLVSLGLIDDGRLLLNLAAAGGPISVEGEPDLARSLIRAWSRRLTTSPWATGNRVIRVGFPHDPDFCGWDVSRLVAAAPVLDVPEGGIVLFAAPPAGRDLYLVDRLLREPVRRWSVVAVGAGDATWRFTVRADGTAETGLLAEPVRLRP
ncbi:hypothetical protein [Mangrovihabitans endophyticus]|uniref:Uncharacterized protein n=1 Tax=Mangrovihabitans endophyticus TaxID=1751298 RepID=A0A8J3C1J1_9ACTN|nr:hypothetical protein [Mangrovihabitans endophyticus]GGK95893.1 hypothetical protein GCM10012284_32590 [Mangrovihabitans endophyticus]